MRRRLRRAASSSTGRLRPALAARRSVDAAPSAPGRDAPRPARQRRARQPPRRRRRPAVPISPASPGRRSRASPTSRRCRSCGRRTRRSRNDPFFRYFFGDDDDMFGSRDRRSLSLGSGVIVSPRRLRRHQQPRRRRQRARDHGRRCPTSARCTRKVVGTDPATDIALLKIDVDRPAGRAVGRLEPAEGRRVGAGHRQPVPAEPDGDGRHRLAPPAAANVGVRGLRGLHPDRRRDQPGQLGRRARSTRAASWSASTPAIFSQSGGYQGIGFAVPEQPRAPRRSNDLMKYGEVRRGSIGYLGVEKLTPAARARRWARPNTNGALVSRMTRATRSLRGRHPAGRRHRRLQRHGRSTTPSQFFRMVADAKIGTTATLQAAAQRTPLEVKCRSFERRSARRYRGSPADACHLQDPPRQPPGRAGRERLDSRLPATRRSRGSRGSGARAAPADRARPRRSCSRCRSRRRRPTRPAPITPRRTSSIVAGERRAAGRLGEDALRFPPAAGSRRRSRRR